MQIYLCATPALVIHGLRLTLQRTQSYSYRMAALRTRRVEFLTLMLQQNFVLRLSASANLTMSLAMFNCKSNFMHPVFFNTSFKDAADHYHGVDALEAQSTLNRSRILLLMISDLMQIFLGIILLSCPQKLIVHWT